jgi:Asp-tRNA(Asn)/Glu-tRNA(Gln) amidotransferase A subunit family amidase
MIGVALSAVPSHCTASTVTGSLRKRPGTSLPVGLQIMAPLLRDDLMYRAAWAFEQDLGFTPLPAGDAAVEVA